MSIWREIALMAFAALSAGLVAASPIREVKAIGVTLAVFNTLVLLSYWIAR